MVLSRICAKFVPLVKQNFRALDAPFSILYSEQGYFRVSFLGRGRQRDVAGGRGPVAVCSVGLGKGGVDVRTGIQATP